MTSSMVVPVIDVQGDNFKELWPAMVLAIKTASFVAVDTELSGLGNRKALLAECIEDRYKAICHAARSRSILSLGIACYKKLDSKAADTYLVQVYNLTLLCSEEYIIEPQSVQFLVQHGFDFNKQYAQGVPYHKGNSKGCSDSQGVSSRALFTELLRARKPLVLHNGLIDMAFLYQCFYAHLPERLATFTADLSEMFPAGIYDTKYATEFELRLTASYLEYAYKKCKLDNSRSVASGGSGPHVHVEFCQYVGHMSSYVDYRECPAMASNEGQANSVCQRFSAFGWCPNGAQCPLSHDTDLIILQDEKGKEDKRSKRKRRKERKRGRGEETEGSSIFDGAPENKISHMELDSEEPLDLHQEATSELCPEGKAPFGAENADGGPVTAGAPDTPLTDSHENSPQKEEAVCMKPDSEGNSSAKTDAERKKLEAGSHRAGFDAFMTGYIFAYACTLAKKEQGTAASEEKRQQEESWLPACVNKVYLSGKAAPLHIVKSTFSKSSKAHVHKMEMVWGKSVAATLADRAPQANM
ncbi:target of EGR1 protein 1 [Myripristis murdjan]|uniref:Target of EGR1 protein 1 n=1 Tax=Myripristis murdjan TaxID=586833 RepID=A0A667X1F8_9TELE|nr:target of EGR1 protein 1 [Myripristis murdjan]